MFFIIGVNQVNTVLKNLRNFDPKSLRFYTFYTGIRWLTRKMKVFKKKIYTGRNILPQFTPLNPQPQPNLIPASNPNLINNGAPCLSNYGVLNKDYLWLSECCFKFVAGFRVVARVGDVAGARACYLWKNWLFNQKGTFCGFRCFLWFWFSWFWKNLTPARTNLFD